LLERGVLSHISFAITDHTEKKEITECERKEIRRNQFRRSWGKEGREKMIFQGSRAFRLSDDLVFVGSTPKKGEKPRDTAKTSR